MLPLGNPCGVTNDETSQIMERIDTESVPCLCIVNIFGELRTKEVILSLDFKLAFVLKNVAVSFT